MAAKKKKTEEKREKETGKREREKGESRVKVSKRE